MRDPLYLDVEAQAAALAAHLGRPLLTKLSSHPRSQLLQELSCLLAQPQYTLIIAQYFRPLLVDLVARWLADDDSLTEESRFVALALLLETHEEIFP
jgi:midasin